MFGCTGKPAVLPQLRRGSAPRVAHGHDIDNFLSIGTSQAPRPVDAEERLRSNLGKVRELQRKLWAAAKQSEERRFHALFDRVHGRDVLWEAWKRVRARKGAAGVDRLTLEQVEGYGVQRMLDELARDLRDGSYRPAPTRRVDIPKPDCGKRPLGIPTVAA